LGSVPEASGSEVEVRVSLDEGQGAREGGEGERGRERERGRDRERDTRERVEESAVWGERVRSWI